MGASSRYQLKSCRKRYTVDQDKAAAPSATVKKALERLSVRHDLSHLQLVQRRDEVVGAYSYNSLSDQLQASGKGLTPEQSQASAIMEFLERYSWLHFDYQNYDGYTVQSYEEIRQGAIDTVDRSFFLNNMIGLRDREELEEEIVRLPLKWIKGASLHDHRPYYYPLNWYNYIFTSNGLATGNAWEEAILQGLCEIIERENVWRLFAEQRPGNDLELKSIRHPLAVRALRGAVDRGIKFKIKDITFDFGVPTIVVFGVSAKDRDGLAYQGCGYGTHPHPEKALIRALSEYFESFSLLKEREKQAQVNWGLIRDKLPRRNFGFLARYRPEMLTTAQARVKIGDLPDISRPDIKDEIETILRTLKKQGHEIIFLDKTHPEVQIPVVRIFCPTFRNLMVSECEDPCFIISQAAYEAGRDELAGKMLRRSARKFTFHSPEIADKVDPKLVFKRDYRSTLLAMGGFKKDAFELLRKYQDQL